MRVLAMLLGLVGGLPHLVIALQLWTGSDWRLINRRAVLRAALAAAASLSIVGAADVIWRPMAAASLMMCGGALGPIMVWLHLRYEGRQQMPPILAGVSALPLLGAAVAHLASSR